MKNGVLYYVEKTGVPTFIFFWWLTHVPFMWMVVPLLVLISVLLFVYVVINLYVTIQGFSSQEKAAQEEDQSS